MKFTFFVFLAGLCLAAATTDLDVPSPDDEDFNFELEYIPSDVADDVTADTYSISLWFGIFFVIQKTLTTLKGVKCTGKEVVEIKDAAQTFVNDIDACGGTVTKKVQQLVKTCNNIIATSNNIIHAQTNICGSTAGNTKTSFKCFWNMLITTIQLKYEIKWALFLIWRVPSVPGEAGACVKGAVSDLSTVFKQFPSNVRTCSKLIH